MFIPNNCIVAGVDPGETSGFGVAQPSKHKPLSYVLSCRTHDERVAALRDAYLNAQSLELPLVIVGEMWSPHGKWGTKQVAGTNAEWGKWEVAIEVAGSFSVGTHKSKWPKVTRVLPDDWREPVLGARGLPTVIAKAMSIARVEHEKAEFTSPMDHNAAEAGCIALWGRNATEVHRLLPVEFGGPSTRAKSARTKR
jgi:hypothetical protein